MAADVRVRLSAEGVAEVVAAFRAVEKEAAKAGKGGKQSFDLMNSAVGQLRALLPAITFGAVVIGLQQLVTTTLDYADATGKMAAKTGASAEALSVLQVAASTADVTAEQLTGALIKQGKILNEIATGGGKDAAKALEDLGLNAEELRRMDPGVAFGRIAEKLGAIEDSGRKSALSLQIWGKSGAELLPLLNDLATEGFDKVAERARAMGLVMSSELVASAARVNDSFTTLGNQVRGFALQFLEGFIPQAVAAMDDLNEKVAEDGAGAWQKWGEYAGRWTRNAILWIGLVKDAVVGLGDVLVTTITTTRFDRAMDRMLERAKQRQREFIEINKQLDNEPSAEGVRAAAIPDTGQVGPRQPGAPAPAPTNTALEAARLAARKSSLDSELKLEQAQIKLRLAEEQSAYAQGLQSAEAYYASRRALSEQATAAEIATLEKKKALLQETPAEDEAEGAKRAAEIAQLDVEIQSRRLDQQTTLVGLVEEERKAREQIAQSIASFEADILQKQGARQAAELLNLETQLQKYDDLLKQQGLAEDARAAKVAEARAVGAARAEFDALRAEADEIMSKISADSSRIRQAAAVGKISEAQAEREIIGLEAERLPRLQEISRVLGEIAAKTGDPATIQAARDFGTAVGEVGVHVDEAGRKWAAFQEGMRGAAQQEVSTFLQALITKSKSVDEAFADMAKGIANSFIKMVADMAAQKLFETVFGAGGKTGGGTGWLSILGFADGGYTGDKPRSKAVGVVHGQEYVVKASAVQKPGVRAVLDSINRGASRFTPRQRGVAQYNGGGMVRGMPADGGSKTLQVNVDPNLMQYTLGSWIRDVIATEMAGMS